MLDSVDRFYISLAVIVVAIVTFIVRAVRVTNASLKAAPRNLNLAHPDVARRLINAIRGRDIPCTRCGRQTSTLLGTGNRYKCDTCQFEFEGPAHMPAETRGITDVLHARALPYARTVAQRLLGRFQ